jgi:hypothetical protein
MIGLLGAKGAVGQAAVEELRALKVGELRLGARHPADTPNSANMTFVDLDDDSSLARFCADCRVVVNCAGPSHRILDRVAVAALSAGADYVDAAGDDPVHDLLAGWTSPAGERTAIVSAGMMPGLSALIPRWIAGHDFDHLDRLTAYVGGLDRFTFAAAGDYLASLSNGYGTSLAAWQHGQRVTCALEPLRDVHVPFFTGPVTAHPYLSVETERLARALSINEVSWYNVFVEGQALAAVNRLQASLHSGADLASAARELVAASELDVAGRTPYQLLLFQLDGQAQGSTRTRSVMLRASDSYRLTGCITAHATAALLAGEISAGVHYAADVLNPQTVVEHLQGRSGVALLEEIVGPLHAENTIERGAL